VTTSVARYGSVLLAEVTELSVDLG
jgi:hypothetical protein